MSLFLYHLFLKAYLAAIRWKAKNDGKARKWLEGRKNIFDKIATTCPKDGMRIWMHCASLGEFEQGRPVIESLKKTNPEFKIILSFFSPSGYEVRKDYEYADAVYYLPMDGKENASRFVSLINPAVAVFVKYEFWYYYLQTLQQRTIPVLLISAAFRRQQPFFKWYGKLFREMLHCYTQIFAQDCSSKTMLESIDIKNVVVSGDTRYDRVAFIARHIKKNPLIENWKKEHKILIAGSTWEDDELLLQQVMNSLPSGWKLIVVPHEIHTVHLQETERLFGNEVIRYSQLSEKKSTGKILLVDNIGMLSELYGYGDIAFVGGGFTKGGIHNILEAAVFGMPVIIGPNYEKFTEALEMVQIGLVFPVTDKNELHNVLQRFMDADLRKELKEKTIAFMHEKEGATQTIVEYIRSLPLYKLANT